MTRGTPMTMETSIWVSPMNSTVADVAALPHLRSSSTSSVDRSSPSAPRATGHASPGSPWRRYSCHRPGSTDPGTTPGDEVVKMKAKSGEMSSRCWEICFKIVQNNVSRLCLRMFQLERLARRIQNTFTKHMYLYYHLLIPHTWHWRISWHLVSAGQIPASWF